MNTIQKKIFSLTSVIVLIMMGIWIALSMYISQTHDQYNAILQRYLVLNEVNEESQDLIMDLNNYLYDPTASNLRAIDERELKIQNMENEIWDLGHSENEFELLNYIHLMDSLMETVERTISLSNQEESEAAIHEFNDATRIATYISDTKTALVETELETYDVVYRGIIARSTALNRFGIWLILLLTATLVIFSYLLSRSITRPIIQLTEAANTLSQGDFNKVVTVHSNDEFNFLARTFNRMRLNINNLIQEIQEQAELEKELKDNKILLQESQFRSLQSQINPHFLFNTLNTISKKAYLEGSEQTSDMLVNVADLLRYNLKSLDRSVTLLEEVTILERYIAIQKARYTERLIFLEDIDSTLLHVQLPALTLQPIIENAIIYSVEPREEGGKILFSVKDAEPYVRIDIEDDGPGMSEEKADKLLKGLLVPKEGHSTGIGFINVVKRMQLFYETDNLIHIESTLGKGTKITLYIPKQRSLKANA
ncbi:sensor histidine kinase [Alkalibacterium sp. 20]|uniref:sensor histidine kinase n=1 Tax=Alkalibacterium sp. 20 TaxID=1798803 RepID=UPI0009000189|nr:sensor histidine kinase [Alkalibacterium sp. 20]OJF94193.1 histidine kinase [Alkalibacterium sp. 20]